MSKSKNKNKKNNKQPRSGQAAPSYRIFGNAVLNDIFCSTEEDTAEFCQTVFNRFMVCVVNFDPTLPPGDKEQLSEIQRRLVAHICGHIEASFELGWNEAMRRASKIMLEDLL